MYNKIVHIVQPVGRGMSVYKNVSQSLSLHRALGKGFRFRDWSPGARHYHLRKCQVSSERKSSRTRAEASGSSGCLVGVLYTE